MSTSTFVLAFCFLLLVVPSYEQDCPIFTECYSEIYCRGDVLDAVCGQSGLFEECKSFVDMPINGTTDEVLEAFYNLPADWTPEQLQTEFIDKYFLPVGIDVVAAQPTDWNEEPSLVSSLKYQPELYNWASELNYLWLNLSRKIVHDPRYEYSSIKVDNLFVVPGGRFREFYYWDAYWIIQGLLLCSMEDTAKGMIENFFSLISNFGYIPNGARIYYINRSQPPLLTQMVQSYYQQTKNVSFLAYSLQYLESEYLFWSQKCNYGSLGSEKRHGDQSSSENQKDNHDPKSENQKSNEGEMLNRYYTLNQIPRPEMYETDIETTSNISDPAQKALVYQNLAAGAATGWDFSSRWFQDGKTLSTIETTNIIPADLNFILFKNEQTISQMYQELIDHQIGDSNYNQQRKEFYYQQSISRKSVIDKYLWNPEEGQWFDYNIQTQKQNTNYYISNYFGLWAQIIQDNEIPDPVDCSQYIQDQNENENPNLINIINNQKKAEKERQTESVYSPQSLCLMAKNLRELVNSEISGPGTSWIESGQQWDYPNSWPPTIDLLLIGMENMESKIGELKATKEDLILKWMRTNYCGFKNTDQMFEKYNVTTVGQPGGGGEYQVQSGFGWTNGVVLRLLQEYFVPQSSAFRGVKVDWSCPSTKD